MTTVTVGAVYTHTILLVNNKIEINKAKRHKLYANLAWGLCFFALIKMLLILKI